MVSRIDSARSTEQTRSRAEPANGEAEERGLRRPASVESDVRLSLSETAKRLARAPIDLGEAPRRNDRPGTDRVDAPTSSVPGEIAEGASDGRGAIDERADERAAGFATYRTPTRSGVGVRISLRV